jgi:hypothetical protein
MTDPLAEPLRAWLLKRALSQPRFIHMEEDAAELRKVLALAGLEVVPAQPTGLEYRGG